MSVALCRRRTSPSSNPPAFDEGQHPLFVTCAAVALCDCAAVALCGCGFVGCGFVDSTIDHRHHCINIFLGSPVQQPAGVFFPSF
ncbi:hypothetical protein L6452_14249 [Arctium lappa]|uniref:Uncharacterized protein n=1 Tax=Arctium lappa TaxID=4217 RepID=A0ACB9CKG1_ARCLA|nr:hypothetical protein L6452_14249 [Arctium lappa]